jgi:hypothetical protein
VTAAEPVPFSRDSDGDQMRATFGGDRVVIADDWCGNIPCIHEVLPRLHAHASDVTTVFRLGDFGMYPRRRGKGFLGSVVASSKAFGIERVIVTPGNHDDWSRLEQRFAARPGEGVQLSEVVWFLPRGFHFTLGGHRWMPFGGAGSIDYQRRIEGEDWWPSETPDNDVENAIAGGPVEVLLTHASVNGGTRQVDRILRDNPHGWDPEALAHSALSRERVTRLWDAVQPRVLVHGHLPVKEKQRWTAGAGCIR